MSVLTPSRASPRGLTLVETVISIFLLLCACLVVIALFHTSLRYSARILQQNAASVVAEKTLARVRAWARSREGVKFNFERSSNWNVYNGDLQPDPEEASFHVRILAVPHTIFSPCSELEKQFDLDRRRALGSSYHRVTVTVSWDPPSPSNTFAITSLIGSPPHRMPSSQGALKTRLEVETPDYHDPLFFDDVNKFRAKLIDADDEEIPDVMFRWHVIPGIGAGLTSSGNGVIDPNHGYTQRTGQRVAFRNNFPLPSNPWSQSIQGQVAVGVVAVYRGLHCETRSPIWENKQ